MSEYIVSMPESDPFKIVQDGWHYYVECEYQQREEIVRCRDCKYYELQTVVYSSVQLSICTAEWCEGAEHDNPLVEPDGFCAWGVKK